jgi:hypothetical protein
MDLTKEYPRSVHEKLHGLTQIARTWDKAKATAFGNVGDYHYNCSMDQHVFGFLGIDHEQFLNEVKTKSPSEVDAYIASLVAKKSPEEIEHFNREWVASKPSSEESQKYFNELRAQVAPDRTDVTAWADLLDLDEKRTVPKRETVNA